MKRPNLAIGLILFGATCMFFADFSFGLIALVVALVILPPKWDPAIQAKLQRENQQLPTEDSK